MVGQWMVTKPARSDEVLEGNQQQKIAAQVRAHYDFLAPKRPTKPNRSESDSPPADSPSAANGAIPELDKFRALQSQSHPMISTDVGAILQEEFVETNYYEELGCIDKQHHTVRPCFPVSFSSFPYEFSFREMI